MYENKDLVITPALVLFVFFIAIRVDSMTSFIMAQSAAVGPFHPNDDDGYPQFHPRELASTLRRVVIEQNGNTNPSSQTVLLWSYMQT